MAVTPPVLPLGALPRVPGPMGRFRRAESVRPPPCGRLAQNVPRPGLAPSRGDAGVRRHFGMQQDDRGPRSQGDGGRVGVERPPSHTVAMRATAEAGHILVSEATALQLHPRFVGLPKGEGFLLKGAPNVPAQEAEPPPDVSGLDLTRCLPVGIRDHLLSGSAEPEHRHVSVAFIEFRGADDCLREKGPDALADALDRCIKDVQEACARHGVTFFETDIGKDGGKIMLVAGAPSSSGNDEAGMLNAVRRIMDRSTALSIRIGVNCGRVFAGDFGPSFRRTYSVKGDAVNLAARVMGKAEPGQILVTEAVLARSSIRFHVQTLEPFSVKGKTRPVHAYALGAAAGRKAIETGDLPLVGREAELATLRQALESATRRRGRVVELVGEPGIGKSRLVNELLAGSLDMTVIVARCEVYG